MFRTPRSAVGCWMVLAVLAILVVIPLGAFPSAAADPVVTWNTFLGGAGHDRGLGITADSSGNIYLTGNSDASWGSPVRGYTATGCDATNQSARTCTVTMNVDKTVTANYKGGQPGMLMLLLDE